MSIDDILFSAYSRASVNSRTGFGNMSPLLLKEKHCATRSINAPHTIYMSKNWKQPFTHCVIDLHCSSAFDGHWRVVALACAGRRAVECYQVLQLGRTTLTQISIQSSYDSILQELQQDNTSC